jgi:hypothetical protein
VAIGNAVPATAIEVLVNHAPMRLGVQAGQLSLLHATAGPVLVPGGPISELPEPDIIAMMLVGLALIGYRATRESTDTFS